MKMEKSIKKHTGTVQPMHMTVEELGEKKKEKLLEFLLPVQISYTCVAFFLLAPSLSLSSNPSLR